MTDNAFASAPHVFAGDVIRATTIVTGVNRFDILSRRQNKRTTLARHMAIFVFANRSMKSLPEIGRLFGGRNHTTILQARWKMARQVETSSLVGNQVRCIEHELDKIIANRDKTPAPARMTKVTPPRKPAKRKMPPVKVPAGLIWQANVPLDPVWWAENNRRFVDVMQAIHPERYRPPEAA